MSNFFNDTFTAPDIHNCMYINFFSRASYRDVKALKPGKNGYQSPGDDTAYSTFPVGAST